MSIPIVVLTNDKHLWLLRGFAHCFNKFWPGQRVTVFGYRPPREPMPANFEFVSLGEQKPVERWSDGLIAALRLAGARYVLLMLEDYWLTKAVDAEALARCWRIVRMDDPLKMDLSGCRNAHGTSVDQSHGRVILEIPRTDEYSLSLQAAVWDVNGLLSLLVPGESPWHTELLGSKRLAAALHQWRVYATDPPLLEYAPVYRARKGLLRLDLLPEELRDDIRERGYDR